MGQVKNKTALVTGGASGVGLETVKLLVREGARVVISDVNSKAGEALASELGDNTLFIHHDVSQEADWREAIAQTQQHFGPLDILINNAGILIPGNIETCTLEQFRQLMQVNAESVFLGCQQGVAAMKARTGSIVNMSSVSSWLPVDNYLGYSASKAAVAAITRTTALYCRKQGLSIRVNSLHPDGIYTPMMQVSAPGVPAEFLLYDPKLNPKGRTTLPERIAQVMLFLASDASSAINGAEIRADGAILGMGL